MVEAIAVDLATSLLGKVLSLAAEEVIQAWNLKESLEDLREKMEMVHVILSDADRRQVKIDTTLGDWLEKLKGVTLEAEFLMDELAYDVLRRKAKSHSRFRKFVALPRDSIIYAHKVKNINSSLAKITKLANDLGLKPASDINAIPQPPKVIRQFVGTSELIGRKDDVSKVVQMLCQNNEKDLLVILILGSGGMGKSALARKVLKHPQVIPPFFQETVWVTVSDDFDVARISNDMIQYLFLKNRQLTNYGAIVRKLQEKLMGKKFLLVLDDVWNKDSKQWDDMRKFLLEIEGARGSTVLVTARNDNEVIGAMQTPLQHELHGLSDEDSWALFTQRAFADSRVLETEELKAKARRMLAKCGGLPLAIEALGGLFRSEMTEDKWSTIENSKTWISNDVVPILRITYDHLPSLSLKRCFSYCSIFPKDFDIKKDELIQIWMALGWLLPPRGKDSVPEDVGDEYFNKLLWTSLLQDVNVDDQANIISCKMHDLVHDLALDVSTKYSTTIKVSTDMVIDVSDAIYVKLEAVEGVSPNTLKGNVGRVKSLHVHNVVLGNLLSKFEHLTVLVLSSTYGNKDLPTSSAGIMELPGSISTLKYLRYLDISELEDVRRLPDFITKLYNLQTLRVYWLEELPNQFRNLISMRHIHFTKRSEYSTKQECCWFVGIERLTCLQTLPYFVASQDKGCHLKELGSLDKLGGELHIFGLCNVPNMEDASKARLYRKTKLRNLVLKWRDLHDLFYLDEDKEYNDEDVMEGLKPHPNLKELVIFAFMGKMFASWMMVASLSRECLDNLVKIKFVSCNRCVKLPPLGHLPKLEELQVDGMSNVEYIGPEFYGYPESVGESSSTQTGARGVAATKIFPSLRTLEIRNMYNLLKWSEAGSSATVEVFPRLENLEIHGCFVLETIPSHFQKVKKLEVYHKKNLGSLREFSSLTSLWLRKVRGGEEQIMDVDKLCGNNNTSSLKELYLLNCDVFTSLRLGNSCVGLEKLEVHDCPNITSIIISDIQLKSLQNLRITYCDALVSFPNLWSPTLKSLKTLWIGSLCKELDHFPAMNIDAAVTDYSFSSLEELHFVGWPKIKSLPEEWLQQLSFPVLRKLELEYFDEMEALPDWLRNLSSLQSLCICHCKKLVRFPELQIMQNLRNLQKLTIVCCDLLKERCAKGSGAEWPKIAHIHERLYY